MQPRTATVLTLRPQLVVLLVVLGCIAFVREAAQPTPRSDYRALEGDGGGDGMRNGMRIIMHDWSAPAARSGRLVQRDFRQKRAPNGQVQGLDSDQGGVRLVSPSPNTSAPTTPVDKTPARRPLAPQPNLLRDLGHGRRT